MFGLKKEKARLTVEGMSCDHCRLTVEKGIRTLRGVSSVQVSLANKQAEIEFNPKQISLDQIKEKVRALGYQA